MQASPDSFDLQILLYIKSSFYYSTVELLRIRTQVFCLHFYPQDQARVDTKPSLHLWINEE